MKSRYLDLLKTTNQEILKGNFFTNFNLSHTKLGHLLKIYNTISKYLREVYPNSKWINLEGIKSEEVTLDEVNFALSKLNKRKIKNINKKI